MDEWGGRGWNDPEQPQERATTAPKNPLFGSGCQPTAHAVACPPAQQRLIHKSTVLSLSRVFRPNAVLLVSLLAIGLASGALSAPAQALPLVEQHELDCAGGFPCPPEIRRRVDFWIKVFRSWNTNQVVFHDTDKPERVYSVKTTNATCRRKRAPREIERERSRISGQLRAIAKKLQANNKQWTDSERTLLTLFPEQNPAELLRASRSVRCQQGNRDRFIEALRRYGKYRNHILSVLSDANLSADIVYLPFVESAFNPTAYSRVGAAGLWQIMPSTARTLGLQLSATIDERFDPEAASWAAAQYLRNSTDALTAVAKSVDPAVGAEHVNPFVITSYNYGLAGMRRAIEQLGPDYVAVLRDYRSPAFRTAVRNFYSSFLAARHVARNAEKYFGKLPTEPPLQYHQFVLTRPTSTERITEVFRVSEDTLKELNPALTRYVWRGWRLIPEGYAVRLPARKAGWDAHIAKLEQMEPEQPQLSGRKYVVQKGDTACGIARIFDVSCRDLIQLNGLNRRALIRVGQKLDVPAKPVRTKQVKLAKADVPRPEQADAVVARASAADAPREDAAAAAAPEAPSGDATSSAETPGAIQSADRQATAQTADLDAVAVLQRLHDNIDVTVSVSNRNGKSVHTIRVEPEETLGHYADWLGIGSTRSIRRLNGIAPGRPIRIGQRLVLPVATEEARSGFEEKRLEYHRTLVDEFSQHYEVLSVEQYVVKGGDTMWRIAHEFELPYWVLTRLNPRVRNPNIGDQVLVPIARARKPSKEPPIAEPS